MFLSLRREGERMASSYELCPTQSLSLTSFHFILRFIGAVTEVLVSFEASFMAPAAAQPPWLLIVFQAHCCTLSKIR